MSVQTKIQAIQAVQHEVKEGITNRHGELNISVEHISITSPNPSGLVDSYTTRFEFAVDNVERAVNELTREVPATVEEAEWQQELKLFVATLKTIKREMVKSISTTLRDSDYRRARNYDSSVEERVLQEAQGDWLNMRSAIVGQCLIIDQVLADYLAADESAEAAKAKASTSSATR